MRKAFIEGINGSIEVTNSFIIVKIGNKKVFSNKGILLSFEEIEDITYKKPTRDKYGHISLYTISEKKYTLLLDKVNSKYLEDSKKLYSIINEIATNNKKVKVEEKEPEEEIDVFDYQEPTKEEVKDEVKEDLLSVDKVIKTESSGVVKQPEQKKNVEVDTLPKKEVIVQEVGISKDSKKSNPTTKDEQTEKEEKVEEVQEESIAVDDVVVEEEQDKNLITIELLEQRLKDLKKELEKLFYKESIIVKYVDDTKDKDEIEKLIIEIEYLTNELEKIKKEVKAQEKRLSSDVLSLDNGNVLVTNINKDFIKNDIDRLNKYIEIYKDTLDKIDSLEKETTTLSSNAEEKKEEINLSEEAYERDINLLYDVEKTRDFIKKYKDEAKSSLNDVRREVETSVDRLTKLRAVRRGISNQTRLITTMMIINSLRGARNRRVNFALGVAFGVSTIRDMFRFDFVEEHYNEITKKETLVGLESVDTESARFLIDDSKKQLDKLLEDCEKNYSDYPEFDDLKSQIMDLKYDIEKEDEELKSLEDKYQEYKAEERVKILKYTEE
jgi:DNA repair exonuclease SbcCD ATPase subunit